MKLRKSILSQGVLPKGTFIRNEATGDYTENNKTKPAMIAYLKNTINQMQKAEVKDVAGIKKRQRLLSQLESEMSGGEKKNEIKPKKPKPPASAIRYLRNNPDKIDEFIKRYGENAVPPDMKK